MLQKNIDNGAALGKLVEMVKAQGGNPEQVLHPELLPKAKMQIELASKKEGYVKRLKALELGTLAMQIGAGRAVKEDTINHAVGIVLHKKDGDHVEIGDSLATIHTDQPLSDEWIDHFYDCFEMSNEKVEKAPLIYKVIE